MQPALAARHRLCWRVLQKRTLPLNQFTILRLTAFDKASGYPCHFPRRHYKIPTIQFHHTDKDHPLDEHIGSCLGSDTNEEMIQMNSSFSVCFLGTGGSQPTLHRISSSTVLLMGSLSFVFDAGEGVQRQLMISRIGFQTISKIFITHMHGDHVLGLPGLLLQIQISQANRLKPTPIDIYGPPGLFNFVAANVKLTKSTFVGTKITVHELIGANADDGGKQGRGKSPQHSWYHEFAHKNLQRERIPRNQDGTWTITSPSEITEDDAKKHRTSNSRSAGREKELFISAAEIKHLPRVPTFGYVVREQDPPMNIDPQKAIALGVRPGEKYKLLKQGFPVLSDDGTSEVQPCQVVAAKSARARKFALVSDNWEISLAMKKLIEDSDVLVHESALHDAVPSEPQERGHSSAGMAGAVAKSTKAKVLVLNHFSNRIQHGEQVQDQVERAEITNEDTSFVVPAHDFMEIAVPSDGFDRVSTKN